jgi:hypothetical protein
MLWPVFVQPSLAVRRAITISSLRNVENYNLLPRMLPLKNCGSIPCLKYRAKSLIYLAPWAGFEPATNRLTVTYSCDWR